MSPRVVIGAVAIAGALLQVLLWSRQWVYGDQYALLLPALDLLATGELPPFAKTMSGEGRIPGALLPLLIAAPLEAWPDYRAPALLSGLTHFAAAALLTVCVGRALGARFAAAYLTIYWLSPWRLYHAGFLWEPAYVFLPAALHLFCAYRLRERSHVGWSILLGLLLSATLQLHGSFLVLVLLTALLVARKLVRIDWRGAALGLGAGCLTLVPTLQAFVAGTLPPLAPTSAVEYPRVILGALNGLRGAGRFLRLGSLDIGRRLRQVVWVDAPAGEPGAALGSALVTLVWAVGIVSLPVALYAGWRWFRRDPSFDPPDNPRRAMAADWFRAYALWCLAALCGAAALSPVVLQGWHVLIAFHAACLPVAAWLSDSFWRRTTPWRAAALTFVAIEVVAVLLLAFGHEMYRPRAGEEIRQQDFPDAVRPLMPDPRETRGLLGPEHTEQARERIVQTIDDALLQGDDRVVGDRDLFRADVGATLGDVAVTDTEGVREVLGTILGVERIHLQRGGVDEVPRADEFVVQPMVAQDVTDVLAKEALDALPELLNPLGVRLRHPPRAVLGVGRARLERLDPFLDVVVPRDVGDEVADRRECLDRLYRHRLVEIEAAEARHAHQFGVAVDLGRAATALARLAVPSDRQIVG